MRALAAVGACAALACATATSSGRPAARAALGSGAVGTAAAQEWQLRAMHVDGVPDVVLRSAAGLKIAVIDTGADVTALGLAARSP